MTYILPPEYPGYAPTKQEISTEPPVNTNIFPPHVPPYSYLPSPNTIINWERELQQIWTELARLRKLLETQHQDLADKYKGVSFAYN